MLTSWPKGFGEKGLSGKKIAKKNAAEEDFPGGPVVKTLFQCRGCGFDPWLGNLDPICLWATKPMHCNHLSPRSLESMLQEKPGQHNKD